MSVNQNAEEPNGWAMWQARPHSVQKMIARHFPHIGQEAKYMGRVYTCSTCGALAVAREVHAEWHESQQSATREQIADDVDDLELDKDESDALISGGLGAEYVNGWDAAVIAAADTIRNPTEGPA